VAEPLTRSLCERCGCGGGPQRHAAVNRTLGYYVTGNRRSLFTSRAPYADPAIMGSSWRHLLNAAKV